MPSVEGLPARRAALQMLDAVLRRGRTLDSAAQASRGPEACGPGTGRRDRRRGPAANARLRRADRRRDAAAAARTTARREWCSGSRSPRRWASELRSMLWSRPPCRLSTAVRGGWFTAYSAPCCAAAFRRWIRRSFRSGRATLEQGVGRGGRCIGAAADRQTAAARSQLYRRCGSEGLRRDHGRQVARDVPCPTE